MRIEDLTPDARLDAWSEADLRLWCVGGWRFQIKGGEVRSLAGGGAAQALARHLAIRHPEPVWGSELEAALSRKPDEPISRASLHVAANKLRRLLRDAAGGGEEAAKLAKELLPRATGIGQGVEAPDDPGYSLDDERVWVDLLDAPDPFALAPPCLDGDEGTQLGGGASARDYVGFSQLREEVEERVKAARAVPSINLAKHLEEFTPPVPSLAALVPVALDRLRPGARVTIKAPGDSGRLHLAEAIELAARVWCGRSTLQIRERTETEAREVLPNHVYVVDLTRELTRSQREALRVIHEESSAVDRSARPAVLLITEPDMSLPPQLGLDLWSEAEPIKLASADVEDAMAAYLIATRGMPRDLAGRRADFERLAEAYGRERRAPIGLRAASAAAAFAKREGGPPKSSQLPAPNLQDVPLEKLDKEGRELAKVLAWFSNSMFTLEDARMAAGDDELSLDQVLGLATRIPGGGSGALELRPDLIDSKPAPEVAGRICERLLREGSAAEAAIERWPERAVTILESERVDFSKRLELVPLLILPCRARGPVNALARAIGKLLMPSQKSMSMEPAAMRAAIDRARLLTYLGKMGDALIQLAHVTRQRKSKERRPLQIEAHRRMAIVAAQLGEAEKARGNAEKALELSDGESQGPVLRFFGWEAMFQADFEGALKQFQRSAALSGEPDERADAILGATQALLRLGRLKEAEENLPKLERLDVRRSTRDRISRVKARTSFLRKEVKNAIEIVNEALPRGDSGLTFGSAHLLEARAYLRALDGDLTEAARDLERAEALTKHPRSWETALLRYVGALIYEKQALRPREDENLTSKYRTKARRKAQESLEEARDNPWHRARAHTLLARMAFEEGDRKSLAWQLRFARQAHRDLEVVCPDALAETVQVALVAADLWQMPAVSEKLDSLGTCLLPRDTPLRIDLEASLDLIDEVAAKVVDQEPPRDSTAEPNLWVLGRVGHAITLGGEEALAGGEAPLFRVIHPRAVAGLERGVYEFDLPKLRLSPMSDRKPQALVRGTANRRFAMQRLGAILVVGLPPVAGSASSQLERSLLPGLAEAFKAKALEVGVAVIERFPLELDALESLGLDASSGFLSLGLAELPRL